MNQENIYDDKEFFSKYVQYREQGNILNTKLEQPLIKSLAVIKPGSMVLDIGCGFGGFCRHAIEYGAHHVIGLDLSYNMIEKAKLENENQHIEYIVKDVRLAEFNKYQFDLIVSSLTLHYINNLFSVINNIYLWLKPGGQFIFSVNHPDYTATLGGNLYNYENESGRVHKWLGHTVVKYHKKLETYHKIFEEVGFSIIQTKTIYDTNLRSVFIVFVLKK